MRLLLILLLTLLFFAVSAYEALAIEDSFYDVESLQVRAKARSEVAAKNAALRNGKERAFKQMIARFLTKRDYGRLEQPNIRTIDDMIRDLQLEEERYGGGIYIATLNIRFRLENVRAYLREIGFAYSETTARPYLLLPVFVDLHNQSVLMWEQDNIWLDNWLDRENAQDKHLLPIYLPQSGAHDKILLPDVRLVNQDGSHLNAIKDYYNTDNVILMIAVGDYLPTRNILNGVQVTAHFLTSDWQRDSIVIDNSQSANATKLLSNVRRKIFDEIQDQWKHNTAIQLGEEDNLNVQIQIRSLNEWLEIKKILEAVPDIVSFRLVQINASHAMIALSFYGTPERLEKALAREFLGLAYDDTEKLWILKATRHLGAE